MTTAAVRETKIRRNGRVKAAQQRRTSAQRRQMATKLPHPRLGWYAGLTVMAVIEIIEWPLAIIIMVGHEIAHRAHSKALRDFAEGVEAAA
jgi:hypothetical protein